MRAIVDLPMASGYLRAMCGFFFYQSILHASVPLMKEKVRLLISNRSIHQLTSLRIIFLNVLLIYIELLLL